MSSRARGPALEPGAQAVDDDAGTHISLGANSGSYSRTSCFASHAETHTTLTMECTSEATRDLAHASSFAGMAFRKMA